MGIIATLIVGAIAGWLGGTIYKGSGLGLIGNIIVGHLYLLVFAEGKDIIFFVSFDRDLEEMSLIVILTHIEVMGTLGKILEGELPLRIGLYRFLLAYQLHGSPRERLSA